MSEYDFLFRVLIVGDQCTGKSALLKRYTEDVFSDSYTSTIGVDIDIKFVVHKERKMKLYLWDTSGDEAYKSVIRSYYKACQGLIIAFDVTERSTFCTVESLLTEIKKFIRDDTVKLLVGNRCDNNDKRCVTEKEAKSLARKNNMLYTDASSKENINVNKAFAMLIYEMYEKYSQEVDVKNAQSESPDQDFQGSVEKEKDSEDEEGDFPASTDTSVQISEQNEQGAWIN